MFQAGDSSATYAIKSELAAWTMLIRGAQWNHWFPFFYGKTPESVNTLKYLASVFRAIRQPNCLSKGGCELIC
jgi:hypothetical protein